MNKTVTINISGIIFHIEEDAYEKLGNYLKRIRSRFSAEDGQDEIMMDIESRVAEILQGKTGPSKQVIIMADVDYVISLMGEPEAISDNAEKPEEKTTEKEKEETSSSRTSSRPRRRLYRDTDDRVVGGVCSGIAYYFDLDPVWIRIGFAISFFVFGTGFLFYILLLIIIPKAETTAEKLEMRGEPVDVNNISRTIKEEFEGFKKKAETFGEEIKSRGKRWRDESRDWSRRNRVRNGFEDFFHGVFRVFGKIIAFALIFFGILFLIGLLTSTFALSDFGPSMLGENMKDLFADGFHYFMAVTGFFLIFGIPILMMIYKGIRMMFKIKAQHRAVGFTALGLWSLGIVFAIISIFGIGKAFSQYETVHEDFRIQNSHMRTLYLNVDVDPDMRNDNYNSRFNRKHHIAYRWKAVSVNGNTLKLGYPQLRFLPSNNDSIQVMVEKSAYGSDYREAQDRARAIVYRITQKDSMLTFSSYFTMGMNEYWRGQDVYVEVYLPKGTMVYLSENMAGILDDNIYDGSDEMVNRRWVMDDTGGLKCIDCDGLSDYFDKDSYSFPKPKKSDSLPEIKKTDTIIIHH